MLGGIGPALALGGGGLLLGGLIGEGIADHNNQFQNEQSYQQGMIVLLIL
jgi:hypothetical protein